MAHLDRLGDDANIRVEWPTLVLVGLCYVLILLALWFLPTLLGIILLAPMVALHGSLTHEIVHGHPFSRQFWNAALVFPAVTLVVPYERFRATHLAHHRDELLTDPYDDPESNYLDPSVWKGLSGPIQRVLRFNNSLFGRMLIGPIVGQIAWMASDWRLCREGDRSVRRGWLLHIPALAMMVAIIWIAPMSGWAYCLGAYGGLSILRIRTYLEHRAHEKARARTVIVEDRGLFSLLFLNNNFHVVHHMHPKVPWYRLPALYAEHRDHYLRRNDGYRYGSYAEIFRQFFFRPKDPVPHPLWKDET